MLRGSGRTVGFSCEIVYTTQGREWGRLGTESGGVFVVKAVTFVS